VGHGQMPEDQLAHVMVDFESAKYDVLVCSTIIESGLDIPNVNTIIVERADRFGLAQLYQLRGRVGRSGRRAYAYFLYDPRRSLTENADKRLDVISGLHELGQGFKIALRDLEIRGAGNLLGTEQHGAIAAVGFEMYLQMLQGAVSKLRTGSEETAVTDVLSTAEMNLDLPLDHFIPRSYIRDEKLRLGAYRQLANAEDEQDLDSMLRSLKDRYGSAPAQLDNLVYSLRVKLRGQRMGLRGVIAEGHDILIRVDPQRFLDVEELSRRMAGRIAVGPNRMKLRREGGGWATCSYRSRCTPRSPPRKVGSMRHRYPKPWPQRWSSAIRMCSATRRWPTRMRSCGTGSTRRCRSRATPVVMSRSSTACPRRCPRLHGRLVCRSARPVSASTSRRRRRQRNRWPRRRVSWPPTPATATARSRRWGV